MHTNHKAFIIPQFKIKTIKLREFCQAILDVIRKDKY